MNSERTPRKLNFEVSEYKSQAFGIEPRANQELSLRIEQRANRESYILRIDDSTPNESFSQFKQAELKP